MIQDDCPTCESSNYIFQNFCTNCGRRLPQAGSASSPELDPEFLDGEFPGLDPKLGTEIKYRLSMSAGKRLESWHARGSDLYFITSRQDLSQYELNWVFSDVLSEEFDDLNTATRELPEPLVLGPLDDNEANWLGPVYLTDAGLIHTTKHEILLFRPVSRASDRIGPFKIEAPYGEFLGCACLNDGRFWCLIGEEGEPPALYGGGLYADDLIKLTTFSYAVCKRSKDGTGLAAARITIFADEQKPNNVQVYAMMGTFGLQYRSRDRQALTFPGMPTAPTETSLKLHKREEGARLIHDAPGSRVSFFDGSVDGGQPMGWGVYQDLFGSLDFFSTLERRLAPHKTIEIENGVLGFYDGRATDRFEPLLLKFYPQDAAHSIIVRPQMLFGLGGGQGGNVYLTKDGKRVLVAGVGDTSKVFLGLLDIDLLVEGGDYSPSFGQLTGIDLVLLPPIATASDWVIPYEIPGEYKLRMLRLDSRFLKNS